MPGGHADHVAKTDFSIFLNSVTIGPVVLEETCEMLTYGETTEIGFPTS